jgi:hypothetical protein
MTSNERTHPVSRTWDGFSEAGPPLDDLLFVRRQGLEPEPAHFRLRLIIVCR